MQMQTLDNDIASVMEDVSTVLKTAIQQLAERESELKVSRQAYEEAALQAYELQVWMPASLR